MIINEKEHEILKLGSKIVIWGMAFICALGLSACGVAEGTGDVMRKTAQSIAPSPVSKKPEPAETEDIVSARETLEFDDEDTLTRAELKQLLADRADHEAQVKKDAEERAAAKGDGFSAEPKKAAKVEDDDDDFDF